MEDREMVGEAATISSERVQAGNGDAALKKMLSAVDDEGIIKGRAKFKATIMVCCLNL